MRQFLCRPPQDRCLTPRVWLLVAALVIAGISGRQAAETSTVTTDIPVTSVQSVTSGNSSNSSVTSPTQSGPQKCYEVLPDFKCSDPDCPDCNEDCTVFLLSASRRSTGGPKYKFACERQTIENLEKFPVAEDITQIDISEGTILGIKNTTFSRYRRLISLQLLRNTIHSFNVDSLQPLQEMSLLYIHDAVLGDTLPRLNNHLYLQDMEVVNAGIKLIVAEDFQNLPSLRSLDLSRNRISQIEDNTFAGACQLRTLSLSKNNIMHIADSAFVGLEHLHSLDLSYNPLTSLPSGLMGLDSVTDFNLQGTTGLKVLPSGFYSLKRLKVARMEYASHCCLFNKPKNITVDSAIPRNGTPYETYNELKCSTWGQATTVIVPTVSGMSNVTNVTTATPATVEPTTVNILCQPKYRALFKVPGVKCPGMERRRRRRRQISDNSSDQNNIAVVKKGNEKVPICRKDNLVLLSDLRLVIDPEYICNQVFATAKKVLGDITETTTWEDVNGALFENTTTELNETREAVKCTPIPDVAFTPCDDLMTWVWLRVVVWFVFLFGFCVNMFVFLVVAFSTRRWDSYRELTLNLVIGDLFIALFLGMLAVADLRTKGDYAAQAIGWQKGAACKSAGFLSVLGSQVTMTTLVVITLERFYRITSNHVVKLKYLRYAMASCWAYSLLSAAMPLFGFSDYSTVATCMPFEASKLRSEIFLALILAINFTMCMLIVFLYTKVTFSTYFNSRKIFTNTGNVQFQRHQFRTLKRSSPLVISTLLCVVPIAIIGLLSVILHDAQIDNRVSKIVLVIVYPINCLANPILYGFGRKSVFRDHMYDFLYKRFGFFAKTFHRRRSKVFGTPTSSRRGSIDSTMSSMSTLRRGLTLPVGILATVNSVPFQRSVSDPGTPGAGDPDKDSAYSSNSGNSNRLRNLCCVSNCPPVESERPSYRHRPRNSSSLPDDVILEDLRKRFAAAQAGGNTHRPSGTTGLTTASSKSTLEYVSPRPVLSPGGLSPLHECDGYAHDPTIKLWESSL